LLRPATEPSNQTFSLRTASTNDQVQITKAKDKYFTQGCSQRGRGHALHNCRLSGFFYGKTGFVGTQGLRFSARSVLWASDMPKMRWRRGLRPDPAAGAHNAPQTPSRLGMEIPPPQSKPPKNQGGEHQTISLSVIITLRY